MPANFLFCGRCGARLAGEADERPGETRQITVLFADISGFTALAERLGPEELHESMRTVWDLIAADIRANDGIIEKYIGDAVVAAFGAVGDETADHPEQAQRAALAILAALERANERIVEQTERRLALRIGVNTGIAVTGTIGDRESEFGVLGDAVNVAARLEQAAEPGEVLVGDATYRRTPGLFSYEPHPPVVARGKTAPLVAWRLMGAAVEDAAPERRTPLVGRDEEMAILLGALNDALAGRGRLVSIVGDSGLGKSRLIDELIADPRVRGARVGRVRCTAYDQHRSYGAIGDLLRRVIGIQRTASADHALHLITETQPDIEPDTRALAVEARRRSSTATATRCARSSYRSVRSRESLHPWNSHRKPWTGSPRNCSSGAGRRARFQRPRSIRTCEP
jgi:class 3 adenylate cyclase